MLGLSLNGGTHFAKDSLKLILKDFKQTDEAWLVVFYPLLTVHEE